MRDGGNLMTRLGGWERESDSAIVHGSDYLVTKH